MQKTPYEGLFRLLDETYSAIIQSQPVPISFEDMEKTNRLIQTLLAEKNHL